MTISLTWVVGSLVKLRIFFAFLVDCEIVIVDVVVVGFVIWYERSILADCEIASDDVALVDYECFVVAICFEAVLWYVHDPVSLNDVSSPPFLMLTNYLQETKLNDSLQTIFFFKENDYQNCQHRPPKTRI